MEEIKKLKLYRNILSDICKNHLKQIKQKEIAEKLWKGSEHAASYLSHAINDDPKAILNSYTYEELIARACIFFENELQAFLPSICADCNKLGRLGSEKMTFEQFVVEQKNELSTDEKASLVSHYYTVCLPTNDGQVEFRAYARIFNNFTQVEFCFYPLLDKKYSRIGEITRKQDMVYMNISSTDLNPKAGLYIFHLQVEESLHSIEQFYGVRAMVDREGNPMASEILLHKVENLEQALKVIKKADIPDIDYLRLRHKRITVHRDSIGDKSKQVANDLTYIAGFYKGFFIDPDGKSIREIALEINNNGNAIYEFTEKKRLGYFYSKGNQKWLGHFDETPMQVGNIFFALHAERINTKKILKGTYAGINFEDKRVAGKIAFIKQETAVKECMTHVISSKVNFLKKLKQASPHFSIIDFFLNKMNDTSTTIDNISILKEACDKQSRN